MKRSQGLDIKDMMDDEGKMLKIMPKDESIDAL